MSIQISGALRDYILATGSLYDAVNGYIIKIFAGAIPATPEADATGNTLLCTVTTNGTGAGLAFETTVSSGVLPKLSADVWSGVCTNTGTATFYRLCATSDTNGASSVARRIQGTVGLAGADLNVTTTTFTTDEEKRIDYFVIGMLTS